MSPNPNLYTGDGVMTLEDQWRRAYIEGNTHEAARIEALLADQEGQQEKEEELEALQEEVFKLQSGYDELRDKVDNLLSELSVRHRKIKGEAVTEYFLVDDYSRLADLAELVGFDLPT